MTTYRCFLKSIITIFSCLALSGVCLGKASKVRVAISSTPTRLSPFFATDANSQNINRLVHVSLTDFNDEMNFACVLCESFEERIENGKHVIKFKLKKGTFFHDGSELFARDVYNSWKLFIDDQNIKSVFRYTFNKIEIVKVIGPHIVEIYFTEFSVENLSNLALLKVVKIKNYDGDKPISFKPELADIIGAGKYKYKKVDALEIELEAQDLLRPSLIFKVVKDETTLALKLINNEIDISVSSFTPRKVEWLKNNTTNLFFNQREGTNYRYLSINHKKKKFKQVGILKAISMLLPRKDLIKYKIKGMGKLANSLYSKAFKDLYQNIPIDHYDPIASQKIFIKLGYKKNGDGFWQRDNNIFSIDWKSSNNKSTQELVKTIKEYFERGGIKVVLSFQEWGTFMRNFKNGNFDMVIGQWVGFTGPDMLKYVFHSESIPPKGGNRGYFTNKELDKALDLATTEENKVVRIKFYKRALRLAFENYAYINLWHPKIMWISRKCIGNIKIYPSGNFFGLMRLENNCE